MAEMRGLGKGIQALIPEGSPLQQREVTRVPLESIRLNRFQPRKTLDESKIHELANSIRESGLIYPLLLRRVETGGTSGPLFELIAGERRYRALRSLGESEAPVVIRDVGDRGALELSLIENLQREELNPMEQAHAYDRLGKDFSMTQEQIATGVGKDRATVANTLRLLRLAQPVQEEVARGRLTLGHARAILAVESERAQVALAQRVVKGGLSVRQVERIVKEMSGSSERPRTRKGREPHLVAAEQKLQRALGTNVQIFHGKSRGWIRVAYYSLKDLDRLIARLT